MLNRVVVSETPKILTTSAFESLPVSIVIFCSESDLLAVVTEKVSRFVPPVKLKPLVVPTSNVFCWSSVPINVLILSNVNVALSVPSFAVAFDALVTVNSSALVPLLKSNVP